MNILFKLKNGTLMTFSCHQNDVNNFCAGDLLHNFLVEKYVPGRESWGSSVANEEAVEPKDLLEALITHCTPSTMYVMADVKGGDADKYLFPFFKAKPFFMDHSMCGSGRRLKVTASVSDYYFNRNSGNQVRHGHVITEIVDAKGTALKERYTKKFIDIPEPIRG